MTKEYTGGSVSYYKVQVSKPTSGGATYVAECNDIIEALGMNYAEGNAFKALWRRAAASKLGISKQGYKDGLYDAEKVVFFGNRLIEQEKMNGSKSVGQEPESTGKTDREPGTGVSSVHPRGVDGSPNVQPQRAVISGRTSDKITITTSGISDHVGEEQSRDEQRRMFIDRSRDLVQGPMGYVGVRGSSIGSGYF